MPALNIHSDSTISSQNSSISCETIFEERSVLTSTFSITILLIVSAMVIGRFAKGLSYHKLNEFSNVVMHTMYYFTELISRIVLTGCILNIILYFMILSSNENLYYYSKVFRDLGILQKKEGCNTTSFDYINLEMGCIFTILIIELLFSITMFYISPRKYDVEWFRHLTVVSPVLYYFFLVYCKYITGYDYFIPIIGDTETTRIALLLILSMVASFLSDSIFCKLRIYLKNINSESSLNEIKDVMISDIRGIFQDLTKFIKKCFVFFIDPVTKYIHFLQHELFKSNAYESISKNINDFQSYALNWGLEFKKLQE